MYTGLKIRGGMAEEEKQGEGEGEGEGKEDVEK